jgi:hypothetical protein
MATRKPGKGAPGKLGQSRGRSPAVHSGREQSGERRIRRGHPARGSNAAALPRQPALACHSVAKRWPTFPAGPSCPAWTRNTGAMSLSKWPRNSLKKFDATRSIKKQDGGKFTVCLGRWQEKSAFCMPQVIAAQWVVSLAVLAPKPPHVYFRLLIHSLHTSCDDGTSSISGKEIPDPDSGNRRMGEPS